MKTLSAQVLCLAQRRCPMPLYWLCWGEGFRLEIKGAASRPLTQKFEIPSFFFVQYNGVAQRPCAFSLTELACGPVHTACLACLVFQLLVVWLGIAHGNESLPMPLRWLRNLAINRGRTPCLFSSLIRFPLAFPYRSPSSQMFQALLGDS